MAQNDTSRLLIFNALGVAVAWPSGQKPYPFRWRKGAGSIPCVDTSIFFSFIVFLPFLLFILTADPVSVARFLRKRISSLRD